MLNRQSHTRIRKARYVQQDLQYDDLGIHCMLNIKSNDGLIICIMWTSGLAHPVSHLKPIRHSMQSSGYHGDKLEARHQLVEVIDEATVGIRNELEHLEHVKLSCKHVKHQ